MDESEGTKGGKGRARIEKFPRGVGQSESVGKERKIRGRKEIKIDRKHGRGARPTRMWQRTGRDKMPGDTEIN